MTSQWRDFARQTNRELITAEEKSRSQSETRAQLDIPAISVVKVVVRSERHAARENCTYYGIWLLIFVVLR